MEGRHEDVITEKVVPGGTMSIRYTVIFLLNTFFQELDILSSFRISCMFFRQCYRQSMHHHPEQRKTCSPFLKQPRSTFLSHLYAFGSCLLTESRFLPNAVTSLVVICLSSTQDSYRLKNHHKSFTENNQSCV